MLLLLVSFLLFDQVFDHLHVSLNGFWGVVSDDVSKCHLVGHRATCTSLDTPDATIPPSVPVCPQIYVTIHVAIKLQNDGQNPIARGSSYKTLVVFFIHKGV